MPDEPRPLSWTEQGQAAGFDDAWHEEWWRRMEESGDDVIAETTLTHAGRRLMVADSQIKDEDGRLLATMMSTHIIARR